MSDDTSQAPTILIAGASRGLGQAMAASFLDKGWRVIGTVRGRAQTPLHDLMGPANGRLTIEILDTTVPAQATALRERLAGRRLDMLFVNAGMSNDPRETIAEVSTDAFMQVMITNALSPLRVIEALEPLVTAGGLIGVMSSGQGSVANNLTGLREVYRGSKAALNMFMRSYAARTASAGRPLVVMAPGWVRTELGGLEGRLSIAESVPNLVEVLLAKRSRPGLEYLDYLGRTVPW